jgi:hypothetical protein
MKPHGRFILGQVVELTDSTVKLQDGRTIDFDFAAIATGSNYAVGKATGGATTAEARKAELQVTDRAGRSSKQQRLQPHVPFCVAAWRNSPCARVICFAGGCRVVMLCQHTHTFQMSWVLLIRHPALYT